MVFNICFSLTLNTNVIRSAFLCPRPWVELSLLFLHRLVAEYVLRLLAFSYQWEYPIR
jgi:hypothetical protein